MAHFPPVAGRRHLCLIYLAHDWKSEIRQKDALYAIRWFTANELRSTPLIATIRSYALEAIETVGW